MTLSLDSLIADFANRGPSNELACTSLETARPFAVPSPDSFTAEERRRQQQFQVLQRLKAKVRHLIVELDKAMSDQVTLIVNHMDFVAMEERWRGLHAIVTSVPRVPSIKIKLLHLSFAELGHDLSTAMSIERSHLYNLVATRELNTLGGEPFGMIICDHHLSNEIDGDVDELYTLDLLASLAERALCPFIVGTTPNYFGGDQADWIADIGRVGKILASSEYQGLDIIAKRPAGRFIGLTVNRVQARTPYTYFGKRFHFREVVRDDGGLWIGCQYVFASTVLREFDRTAWFGFLKLVSNAPGLGSVIGALDFAVPMAQQPRAEQRPWVRMTNRMAEFYADQGFIALADGRLSPHPFFVGNTSLNGRNARSEDKVLGQIQSMLISCRIAHFVKVVMRTMIGQVMRRDEVQHKINRWIEPYVRDISSAEPSAQASFPLKQAKVIVTQAPGSVGQFECEIAIVPQYQVDRLLGEVRLKTELGSMEVRR